jgi:D-alanine-D-alanine ligase
VQGLLELLDIPYGGTGVLGAAVTMDKIVAKKVFAAAGLEQAPYVTLSSADLSDGARRQGKIREIRESLKLPWFVKPANMGSSVGITKVCREEDLEAALEEAAGYDSRLVVEQGIDARELETGVMGNDELEVAEVGEIMPAADFYSYDDKYINGASKLAIPADISKEQREAIREMAARAYRAAGCFGFSRCDFLMDRDTGRIYINEINSIPGFTDISMFPKLFLYCGYTYPGLIERIIELGYEKYNAKNNR